MRMAVYKWQIRCKESRYQADKGESQSANQYRYTLQFCVILDTEFSNVTVNKNKKTHFFFKNREQMHRFPEHCKPWGSALSFPSLLSTPVLVAGSALGSAPAERNVARAVASLLHQRFVEFPPGAGMYARPAVFAVILQTGDVGTEERANFPPQRVPWHSSHIWSSSTYGFTSTWTQRGKTGKKILESFLTFLPLESL